MLAPQGRLKGDLTLFNWGDGTWWIMGSYYLREWHMRWFAAQAVEGVQVEDISGETGGFSLAGPNSRKVLERLVDMDISNEALPFMGCGRFDVGLHRTRVGRLSVAGELGYEINCHILEHLQLREALLKAGEDFGLREYGYNALNSLRLEKSFGIWSKEFTQGYTPRETGMSRWIDWNKPAFIGREAAMAEHEGPECRQLLVTLEIDAADADASGFEPLWDGDERVGFVTSGGYGHCVEKSLAMALVKPEYARAGVELRTHIVGVERAATVIPPSPHDPAGQAMRG